MPRDPDHEIVFFWKRCIRIDASFIYRSKGFLVAGGGHEVLRHSGGQGAFVGVDPPQKAEVGPGEEILSEGHEMTDQDEVARKFREELHGAARNLRNLSFAAEYMGNAEASALLRCIGDLLQEQALGKLVPESAESHQRVPA